MLTERKAEMPTFQVTGTGRMSLAPSSPDEVMTYTALADERMVTIILPSDPEKDNVVVNNDGTITRIAATPSINGVQWPIPAQQKTTVPWSIYKLLEESELQPQMLSGKQQGQMQTGRWLGDKEDLLG